MYKRIWKGISIVLVLAMLAELLPASLLGNFILRAAAAEPVCTAETYSYDVPQENSSEVYAEIPPTFIDETADTAPEAEGPDTESPAGGPSLPQLEVPALAEEDYRALALLKDHPQFSALAEEDAAFLCAYTEIPAASYIWLEANGIALISSVSYARLAMEYDRPLSEIVSLGLSDELRQTLLTEISIYKALLREDLIGTALDQELRGYLLQGHSCEQVFNAYGVSETLHISMEALLEEDGAQPMPSGLSAADVQQIQSFSASLEVAAAPVAVHAVEHDLTASEIEAHREEIDWKRSELMVSPQSGDTPSEEAPEAAQNPYLGAPYTYNSSDSEKVALNSGALIYENADYVLPGVNGLDLVIGRRYDSQDAGVYTPTASEHYSYVRYYLVTYGYKLTIMIPGGGVHDVGVYTYNGIAHTESEAAAYCAWWRSCSHEDILEDGTVYAYACFASYKSQSYREVYYSSATKENLYLKQLYGLGQGWSFQFSSIESSEGEKYLRLSNGCTYQIDWNKAGSHLKDYPLTDMVLDQNCREFSSGGVSSQYRLSYQDGRREYFSSDGRLIGIQDRYGNTITLVHSTQNGYPHITITDTLDRVTVISGQDSASGHTMTVSLPDGVLLTYQIDHHGTNGKAQALAAYTDPAGSETHYSYTIQDAGFNIIVKGTTGATNQYLNLTTITHPTGAQSVYTYAPAERNLGRQGLMQVYRVASRLDRIGTMEHNQLAYTYSANDCSGYPAQYDPENLPSNFTYSATVTNAANAATTVSFNHKHLQAKAEIRNGTALLQAAEYAYDGNKLPIQETAHSYSAENQAAPLTAVTAAAYDGKGNVTASWTALANGDTADTEHKTSYTYDSTYGLLLTKTYKTDAGTTVALRNTLDESKKNIIRTEIYENDVLKSRTDYTYDSHGNVTSEKRYHDGFVDYDLTEYTYQDNAYLSQEKHTGILTADGGSTVSSPGQTAGTIVTNYTYDTLGRMTSTTDGSGNVTGYTYDALGNVTQITNPDSTTVSYDRNYTQNTLTVTDENGAQVKYTYTPLGLEFETVDVRTGSVITRKEYDSMSRLSKVSDFVYGAVTEYAYDALDRVTSETVKQGETVLAQTLYAYDDAAENGRYQKVTKTVVGDENAPSIVTTQYTDKNGNVVKTGKFLNGVEYFDTAAYDYVGNVITQLTAADAAKNLPFTAKYEYNENGQVTKTYNAENQYTTNTYNALGQLTATTDYAGTPTTYTYDALGRLLTQTITIEDGVTATSKYDYDACGNIIREYKPTNAVGSAETWSKTEYAYTSRQKLTTVKQYDGARVASETSYTYDGVGNMLTMTAGGNTTSYTYDRFGNTLTMTDPLGQTEAYTYTPLGKPLTKTDRNGTVTTYTHDALGRPISTTAGTGENAETIQYTYTKTGQIRTEENGWQRTAYTYDALGRVIQTAEHELNLFPEVCYTVTLDPNGGQVSPAAVEVTEGSVYDLPVPTRAGYVFLGWYLDNTRISNGDPVSLQKNSTFVAHWTESQYTITLDPNGGEVTPELVEVAEDEIYTLPTPARTGYTFQGWYLNDTLVPDDGSMQLAGSCTLTAHWTANSYRIIYTENYPKKRGGIQLQGIVIDPNMVQSCQYDQDVTLYDCPFKCTGYTFRGWATSADAKDYEYSAGETVRNLTAVPNGTVILYAKWSTRFEIIEPGPDIMRAGIPMTYAAAAPTDELISYTKTYTYDLAGNRTGFQLVKGIETVQDVSYTYDNLNRLSTVSENGSLQATYTYDANGNRASLAYANGTQETYAYNKANWITGLENKKGGNTLSSFAYTYYASGSQKSETDHTGKVTSYLYDGLGRLIKESETNGLTVNYTYDSAGNRSKMAVTGTETYTTVYAYDANNRLLTEAKTENSETVTTSYAYDANGNTLTKATPAHGEDKASSTTYSYNGFNQLIGLTVDGTTVAYAYNAQGIRTAKRVNTLRTAFLLDGSNVVAEVQNNTVTDNYLRGVNLIRRETNSETEYYLFNAHGDVVTTTNPNGTINQSYDYDAFGNEKDPDVLDANPFRYCGEYLDFETGDYYLRARYYDPTIGRFTQQDTHWNPANMIYGDNPQKINEREDNLGLKTCSYAPQIMAVIQSGNLYVYCINNPVGYKDSNGENILVATESFLSLSDFYPTLITGISAIFASLGTSFWTGVGIFLGVAVAGVLIYELAAAAAEYLNAAEQAKAWVCAQVAAGGINPDELRDHSVYVIMEKDSSNVVYVGRTKDYSSREYKHQKCKDARFPAKYYIMMPIATGLTLNEARALEQSLITAYTLDALMNAINSIAKYKWGNFLKEFHRMQQLLSGIILDN